MNDIEIDSLQILLNNELLLGVVRKLFNEAIEVNKPQIMPTDDNALLGERYRTYELSKNIMDTAFTLLNSYKKGQKVVKTINRHL